MSRRTTPVLATGLTWLCYILLAAGLLWPLPLHLQDALPGDPSGDLGVYVWNLWIFRHELLDHAQLPFTTDHVFAYSGEADFSLHNYTPIAGLVGMPLMPLLGVVPTFNLILILFVAASGWATSLLARDLGLSRGTALAVGALFIATPVITAREVAHFSLVSTASLPLFLWALRRVLATHAARDAVMVGALVAFASYSDAYFGVYCVLMGLFQLAWNFVDVSPSLTPPDARLVRLLRSLLTVSIAALVASVALLATGMPEVTLGSAVLRIGLHTPVMAVTLSAVALAWLWYRPRVQVTLPPGLFRPLVGLGAIAVVTCLVLLAPPLLGLFDRIATGRMPDTPVFWRSSPRGVDLLAYLVPNPLHPWFGAATATWLMPPQEDAFPEFVGAFSLVALGTIAVAARLSALPRFWVWFTAFFASLSLGPFIQVFGFNTTVPGPWSLLRYVPVIGMARAPSRFSIVAVLGASILFGFAVEALRQRAAAHRRLLGFALAAALVFEMSPVPRALFPADVPAVYDLVAQGDESRAVLELPTGVRDGTSSLGNFNASSQYYQTRHRRRLVGGYLSRVSEWRRRETMANPTMRVLVELSEPGRSVEPAAVEAGRRGGRAFLARSCVGYVVLNRRKASAGLRAAAVEMLGLETVHADERYELLRPADLPPCAPRERRRWSGTRGQLAAMPAK